MSHSPGEDSPAAAGPAEKRPPALLELLHDPRPQVRRTAMEDLIALGAATVPALAPLLEDRDLQVRMAAAQALGEIGDEAAVPALTTALTRQAAPPNNAAIAIILVLTLLIGVIGTCAAGGRQGIQGLVATVAVAGVVAAGIIIQFATDRRHGSQFGEVVADALTRIAIRQHTPALRVSLPVLYELRDDLLHQNAATRQAAERAIAAINHATRVDHDLPLPSAAPSRSPDSLPLPAGASETVTDDLPLAAGERDSRDLPSVDRSPA